MEDIFEGAGGSELRCTFYVTTGFCTNGPT